MQARAFSMVSHGITTARDLGGTGGALALRALIQHGSCVGPRLLCAGQPLTKVRGHCHQWGGEVRDEAQIREVVARQLRSRADVVKVMATGGVRTAGTNPQPLDLRQCSKSGGPLFFFDSDEMGFTGALELAASTNGTAAPAPRARTPSPATADRTGDSPVPGARPDRTHDRLTGHRRSLPLQ